MTVDEIIEKVEAESTSFASWLTATDLKLLANHAKALKIAEAVLFSIGINPRSVIGCAYCVRYIEKSKLALQAITRIKEGRDEH
jgi:hypothetical protein